MSDCSCVLRVDGVDLDLDQLLETAPLAPLVTWRRGNPRGRAGARGAQTSSGATFAVGSAAVAGASLEACIDEVRRFMHAHGAWLAALATHPAVEARVVDFATHVPPPFWASRTFPADLLGLLGGLRMDLCISFYPAEPDDPDAAAPG